MTNHDVVRALKCCTESHSCSDCPLCDDFDCNKTLLRESLDLINLLNMTIENDRPKVKYKSDFDLDPLKYALRDLETTWDLFKKTKGSDYGI